VSNTLNPGYHAVIHPQMPIWVSSQEPSGAIDPDGSQRTIPDRHARGVVVDFSVLLLSLQTRKQIPMTTFRGRIRGTWTHLFASDLSRFASDFTIGRQFLALLLEGKRPPPRHSSDIKDHIKGIRSALARAQDQVIKQAACFFLSAQRFSGQKNVFVMVACGEWFQVRVISTSTITQFANGFLTLRNINDIDELSALEKFFCFHEAIVISREGKIAEMESDIDGEGNDEERSKAIQYEYQEASRLTDLLRAYARVANGPDKTAIIQAELLNLSPPYAQAEMDYYECLTTRHAFSHQLPPESSRRPLTMADFREWTRPINAFTEDADRILNAIRDLSQQHLVEQD
jgi:hypothetical protein